MSSRTWLVGFAVIVAPSLPPQSQQSSLRVLHVTPESAILPTDPVTITFDRPVVGTLGNVIDPARIASLQPDVPVRFDWRDPSTLRLVPLQPFVTGQVVTLVIDTTLVALDGSRLTTPARIPIRVKGPAMRVAVPPLTAQRGPERQLSIERATLPADGHLRVLYSSDVDTVMLGRVARYTFITRCRSQAIPLRVATQRPLADHDSWHLRSAVGYDSLVRAMARVVELVPVEPLPDGCPGTVTLPSLDSLDAKEITYPIYSAPAFAFSYLVCAVETDCARSETVALFFTSPISQTAVHTAIHVDGAQASIVPEPDARAWITLRLDLAPRSSRRITEI